MNNFTQPTNYELLLQTPGYRPLAGRCVIRMDTLPSKTQSGLLHVPDAAQYLKMDQQNQNKSYTGVVLAMTRGKSPKTGREIEEDFRVGDHVFVMLAMEDLDRPVISTLNTRVYVVHECGEGVAASECGWRSVTLDGRNVVSKEPASWSASVEMEV